MAHFTYKKHEQVREGDSLQQGDILERNDGLNAIIKEVHPHYLKEDYLYFIVLTQSCDLVPRKKGLPKSPYITIAAIRPLGLLLSRVFGKKQTTDLEKKANIVHESYREEFHQFLERLFNNNEPEYFYLHEDGSINFPKCVAFLRLSISIKSDLHYRTCLDARIASLESNFKSKLGWLVGNMYSRVGTPDWVPGEITQEKFKDMINRTLENSVFFLGDEKYKLLRDNFSEEEIAEKSPDEILRKINGMQVKSKKDILIESLLSIIEKRNVIEDKQLIDKFLNFVKNDKGVNMALKP